MSRLTQLLAGLPPDALVPVHWVRAHLEEEVEGTAAPSGVDLTVEDVARRLGRGASTVRTWLGAGRLQGYRLNGREWRIPVADLEAFLRAEAEAHRRRTADGRQRSDTGRTDTWRHHFNRDAA